MALDKQNLAIPFSTGVDTKTDPLQVMPAKLIDLQNAVFTLDKRLTKRNGFGTLTSLPSDVNPTTLTTFKGNLTAIGSSLQAYNENSQSWVNHGRYQPVKLDVLPLVRSSYSQSAIDLAVNGTLSCTVYSDSSGFYCYQINDATTGQLITGPINLESTASQARVFSLGTYFVVTYLSTSGGNKLKYIAIPQINPASPNAAVTLSSQVKTGTTGYDGYVADNTLYVAWNGSDVGGAVRATALNSALTVTASTAIASQVADLMSVVATSSVVWVTYYSTAGTALKTLALNPILSTVLAPTSLSTANTIVKLTSSVNSSGNLTAYTEVSNSYPSAVRSDYITKITCTQAGVVGSLTTVARSVGLASKAFTIDSVDYLLSAYNGAYQPTYMLIDGSGNAVGRLAYSNGGGYTATQVLSGVTLEGSKATIGYQLKDLIAPVSKDQSPAQTSNIYSQTGVNLASFDLTSSNLSTAEIGNNLHIAGGFLWAYDGSLLNEQGFHFWPEDITTSGSTTGGSMTDSTYYYQVVYEWTDTQGNLMRSAPSTPMKQVLSGVGTTGSVTLVIPTLRISYKPNVRITIYRWSTSQQAYYLVTSLTSPTLNNPAVDTITYIDTKADSSILGNLLIYTTGGVVENIPGPSSRNLGLFKNRLVLVPSEDRDLVWYSKQVQQATPVEMFDGFTIYTAPTTSSQGSTGPTEAIAALDDKLICFKRDAAYYIVGNGPDSTGANNDFSDAVFITSTVGCSNQQSIVFSPSGLIFQSDKGLWLLGRGLETMYIGAPVEKYNTDVVTSSVGVPGTNQVRLCLDNGKALMYDYYYDRWGTFTNTSAVSSCIYQSLHTYLNSYGQVMQETPGLYVDGSQPVLMAFTTAWFNLMGLQGFQRAYLLYILGNYISPHTLSVTISYDYGQGPTQQVSINPTNYAGTWGSEAFWGNGTWGGPGTLEQWRIFLSQQKMQAFQVTVQEQYDSSFGVAPGAGLTLSGLNLVVGAKKGFVPLPSNNSAG
jgi:hypothetical protein